MLFVQYFLLLTCILYEAQSEISYMFTDKTFVVMGFSKNIFALVFQLFSSITENVLSIYSLIRV